MTPTEKWLKEHLQIPIGANVGDVTIPFERAVMLLEAFNEYQLTKDICPTCGSYMMKINDEYICEMC